MQPTLRVIRRTAAEQAGARLVLAALADPLRRRARVFFNNGQSCLNLARVSSLGSMIDLGPRIYGLGRTGSQDLPFRPKGKRKLYDDPELLDGIGGLKRLRHTSPLDSGTTFEIVVVDENWEQCGNTISIPDDTSDIINLEDLGPLNGTSSMHNAILREAHLGPEVLQRVPASTPNLNPPLLQPQQPPPPSPDPDIGDLEWLINFKVDSVFEPRTQHRRDTVRHNHRLDINSVSESILCHSKSLNGSPVSSSSVSVSSCSSVSSTNSGDQTSAASIRSKPPTGSGRYGGPGKPPFTYTELIELALKDKGRLTVKEIYQWITKHFPFYKAVDERWKNSVRHNLSINPHFRKESKAPQGAGHLWVVVDNTGKTKNSWKEERIQNFLASQSAASETEKAAATIALSHDEDPLFELGVKIETASPSPLMPPHPHCSPPPPPPMGHLRQLPRLPQPPSPPPSPERVSLERSAEEILSGIKRQVGVEFVPPVDLDGASEAVEANAPGFLYPELSKEQLLAESGLYDELAGLCFINDMLGTSDHVSENLFSDELGLSNYELQLSG